MTGPIYRQRDRRLDALFARLEFYGLRITPAFLFESDLRVDVIGSTVAITLDGEPYFLASDMPVREILHG